jgi:hypothetical protein
MAQLFKSLPFSPKVPKEDIFLVFSKYFSKKINRESLMDLKRIGDIAQLVERCFCTADVSGSSPLISNH